MQALLGVHSDSNRSSAEPLDRVVCIYGAQEDDIARCRTNVSEIRDYTTWIYLISHRFPDIDYFRDQEVQTQLTNILFVYSSAHPDIGYRQGMHELLACLYYALDYDSLPADTADTDDEALKDFCSRPWVAADAWTLFTAVMQGAGRWYEWQERKSATSEKQPLASHVQMNLAGDPNSVKPYIAPIVQACNRVQSILLKSVDPELWKRLQSSGIEPQIYGM